MQTGTHDKQPEIFFIRRPELSHIFGGLLFVLFLLALFSSLMHAQGNPVDKIREDVKTINVTVGKPIENDNTVHVLKTVDKVPGLALVIRRYNEKYGNDSVHATRYVDREPDEQNTTDKLIQNYYDVVVVSDSAHQVTRWYSFAVRKDFKEVLYYDLKNAKTAGMEEWKKLWPASEFLGTTKKYTVSGTKQ